jgi:Uma2 family endonuclease
MATALSKEELVEELYRLPSNMKAEIVDSRIVPISPAGGLPSRTSGLIFAALLDYASRSNRGVALPGNAAFLVDLPNRGSFSPDASYCVDKVIDQNFVDGAPVFAAEVRSKDDYGPKADRAMLAKIADYFAAGTLVVWDVDALREKVIRVYRAGSPEQPTIYGMDDEAEAEPALPGWRVAVNTLLS